MCPTLCPTELNGACRWLQVEDGGPDWGISHVDRKKSAQASPSFAWQAVGVQLGRDFFDQRRRGRQAGVDNDPPNGLNDRDHAWLVR